MTVENLLLRICKRHRLPPPQTQQGLSPRVDFIWHEQRLVVEADSWQAHATRHAFQHDRTTTNALQLAGYTVLRYTEHDLTRRPREVAAQIAQALSRRRSASMRCSGKGRASPPSTG